MSERRQLNALKFLEEHRPSRGFMWGALIIGALIAFEVFNYSTTDFAMNDLLGDLQFMGLRWSTILALAFCGIDFAGIARLFSQDAEERSHQDTCYLFGAWLLAATMNAMLTWWGVSIALLSHQSLGNAVIARETLIRVVPVFVAIMVWLIRVLIIGSFSVAGERLFAENEQPARRRRNTTAPRSLNRAPAPAGVHAQSYRPAPKRRQADPSPSYPTVSASSRSQSSQGSRHYGDPAG